MKSKIIKISTVIVGFLVCLCFPFAMGGAKIEKVQAATETRTNRYLINESGNGVEIATENLGETSGYGKFVLEAENVTLIASAYEGYKIVGWHITYTEEGRTNNTTQFIKFDEETPKLIDKNDTEREVDIQYEDNYTKSTFTLAKVFEDMIIEPVFDYIYYYLDISSFVSKIELPSNSIDVEVPNFGTITAYYNNASEDEGVTEYSGVILKFGENSFRYAGTVYYFDADTTDHQHFVCNECGRVYDMFFALPQEIIEFNLPEGFTHNNYKLYFFGVCKNCR